MTLTPEQVLAANKANLETLVGLTNKAFSGVEQLIELNLAAAKSTLADSQKQTHAALSVKDAQELLAFQASLFQPLAEKAVAYNRHLADIATGTSSHFQGHMESQLADAQKAFHALVDNAAKNAPAGSETAVAAFKTAVSAGSSALSLCKKRLSKPRTWLKRTSKT
jgi:phasin family protein